VSPVADAGAVLAIVGPTASGKSSIALEIARRGARVADGPAQPVEIVAVDAFTVYRGMDVGTAKPPPEIREEIPHHMIDLLDPTEEQSVSWFQRRARAAVDEVRERGAVPLLVGGSGLYFRAVVDDLRFPPTDPEVRAGLERRYAEDPERAHRDLAEIDPAAAAKIEPGNLRRSVRALEVIELTDEMFSSFADAWDRYESVYPGFAARGVDRSSSELRERIGERTESMIAGGLLDEARRLRELRRPLSETAREAIGYKEAFAVLDGEAAEDALAEMIARRTWRYARRQRSWFTKDPRIVWSDPDEVSTAWT
jgi:tRNA dimethylallyltransferase